MIDNFFTDVPVVFCTLPAELFYSLIIEVTTKLLSRQTNTAHIHRFLLAFAITMEIDEENNIGREDYDENGMDFSLIIAQCIINSIALIQCLRRRRCKQQHFFASVQLCKSYYLQITGICQGKPKLIFDMVRPSFASKETTLESLVIR
jgi:hypothetical protein